MTDVTPPPAVPTPSDAFTVPEVAAALRVSERTVYRAVESGALSAVRVGERGPLRIPPSAVRLGPARSSVTAPREGDPMLNNEISRNPITDLAIPPDPPKAVLTAREPFDRLADELSDTIDERRAAERDALQAESAAIRQAADDYAAGQQPDDPGEAARPHRERARTAETKIAALRLAVDDAGNRYADAIAEHADPWAAKLRKREADALAAYRAALDTALAALTNLAAARAGADWLDGFDAIQAHHGRVQPFPGGRIRIKTRETIQRGDIDPRKLLAIAATVAEPTSAPQKAAAA